MLVSDSMNYLKLIKFQTYEVKTYFSTTNLFTVHNLISIFGTVNWSRFNKKTFKFDETVLNVKINIFCFVLISLIGYLFGFFNDIRPIYSKITIS